MSAASEKDTDQRFALQQLQGQFLLEAGSEYDPALEPEYNAPEPVDPPFQPAVGDTTAAFGGNSTLDRLGFTRRCCMNGFCAFKNIQDCPLPANLEEAVVDAIEAFENSSRDERWESLSKWIVDKNHFRMPLQGDDVNDSVELCTIALQRILDFKDHHKIFLHVLRVSVLEVVPDCPVQEEREGLIRQYFANVEKTLKEKYEQDPASFSGKSVTMGLEEYCEFVTANGGQKMGNNFFSQYWHFHYPKILTRIGVPVPKQPSSGQRRSSSTNAGSAVTPSWMRRMSSRSLQGSASRKRGFQEEMLLTRNCKARVIVTRTPRATVRARRRKAGVVRRAPVYAMR